MAAYLIFTQEKLHDQKELDIYESKVPASIPGHSLEPLAMYGAIENLEGDPVKGAVVLRFPTMEAARAWYHSDKYQEAKEHRLKAADYRVFLIEGV